MPIRVALLMLLALASAEAQYGDFKLTGTIPSASFFGSAPDGSWASGQLDAVKDPNFGEALLVQWNACGFEPPGTPGVPPQWKCDNVFGLAPMSAVRTRGDRRMEVDFGSDTMLILFSGPPTPSKWTGAFSTYDGLYSYSQQTTGTYVRTETFPVYPSGAVEYRNTLSGNSTWQSSIFTGRCGPASITPAPMAANGSLSVRRGMVSVRYKTIP